MPEVADIFRDGENCLKKEYSYFLSTEHHHAIKDIISCRTPEMGYGTLSACPNCGKRHFMWQSCGNRNCPKCGHEKVTRWLQKRQEDILPVDYYMATFTLGQEFHRICRQQPRQIFEIFFKTASTALKELALDKKYLGGKIGMMGTLQTWRRDGEFHPHIHFLIPGGGLSNDGKYWLFPKNRDFLVPAKPLAILFRNKFRAALREFGLYEEIAPVAWSKNWVVDIKKVGKGMSSFKYVAPYMQRGFIGNNRIVEYDGINVKFRYKDGRTDEIKYRTLNALKFMLLYLQHVLPSGFMKTRYYGLEASANKQNRREIRLLILTSRHQPVPEPEEFIIPTHLCSRCGTEMKIIEYHSRPPPEWEKCHE